MIVRAPRFWDWLGAAAAVLPSTPAMAQASTSVPAASTGCTPRPTAAGLSPAEICMAHPPAGGDENDAYYLVDAVVVAESGFGSSTTIEARSAAGRALDGIMSTLLGHRRVSTLDLSLVVQQDTTTYPAVPLIHFERTDRDHWQSSVNAGSRTLLHLLRPDDTFHATVSYAFSVTAHTDPGSGVLGPLARKLVTPGITPILTAAAAAADVALHLPNADVHAGYNTPLGPSRNDPSRVQLVLTSPSGIRIATITLTLLGTRSLTRPAGDLAALDDTRPAGRVDLDTIARAVPLNDGGSGPLLGTVLGSSTTLSAVLGRQMTPEALHDFCFSLSKGATGTVPFTTFDSLMIRARLVQIVADGLRPKVNPYVRCFGQPERALIATGLGISNIEAAEPAAATSPPPASVTPLPPEKQSPPS
ncbi:hypothetical protein [Sphingomonas sp.]|uniref:hypothetical protein n=1 Tax=Sphingomonas sp. TaxID=28214 RepID=UPI003CC607FD